MSSKILGVAPYLLVEEISRSAEWYRDSLGFDFQQIWGEPPAFAMVKRDDMVIMLKSLPGKRGFIRPNHTIDADACWDAYLWVTGVDALYREFKGKGVRIRRDLGDMPYGNTDFDIEDCNGYVLCFGEESQTRRPPEVVGAEPQPGS